jgi:hypothetical protein
MIASFQYQQDSFVPTIPLLCALDKAVLVCACRHVKATGEIAMGTNMLWLRLQDFMRELHFKNSTLLATPPSSSALVNGADTVRQPQTSDSSEPRAEIITLILPPYTIFEQALYRLLEHGIFRLSGNKTIQAVSLLRLCIFRLRPEISSITTAFRGSPFAVFLKDQ